MQSPTEAVAIERLAALAVEAANGWEACLDGALIDLQRAQEDAPGRVDDYSARVDEARAAIADSEHRWDRIRELAVAGDWDAAAAEARYEERAEQEWGGGGTGDLARAICLQRRGLVGWTESDDATCIHAAANGHGRGDGWDVEVWASERTGRYVVWAAYVYGSRSNHWWICDTEDDALALVAPGYTPGHGPGEGERVSGAAIWATDEVAGMVAP